MGLIALEHSKGAYRADFAIYGIAVASLAVFLVLLTPPQRSVQSVAFTLAGLFSWTAIEYALHRFVLHGLPPFRAWHEAHHQRPTALICAPTILSAALIVGLIFLPMLELSDLRRACAMTLGVVAGYLAYAVTHHATHHWRADGEWLKRRKRWHALHHHHARPGCYGVTSPLWDHVFGSAAAAEVAPGK